MFNPLKSLGNMNQMRKKAMAMQEALSQEEIVVEKDGVRVVMTGDQKIKELTIDGEKNQRIAEVLKSALAKTQTIAAQKMMQMGGM